MHGRKLGTSKEKFPFSAQCSLLPHAWKEMRNVQKVKFPFNAQCIHLFVLSRVLTRSRIFNFGTNNIFSPKLIVNELRFERYFYLNANLQFLLAL